MEDSYFLEIGFCVVTGLIGLFERGFYVNKFVKKRRYWPTEIYINVINVCGKKGDHGRLSVNCKRIEFDMLAVNKQNYNMIMMSEYSGIVVHEGQKEEYGTSKVKFYTFQ